MKCPRCNKTQVVGDTFAERCVAVYPKRYGNKLLLKDGKYGEFMGCESFPLCDYSEPTLETKLKQRARARNNAMAWMYSHSSPNDLT